MYFKKYFFKVDKIKNYNIFKIKDLRRGYVFVSDSFYQSVIDNNLRGFKLEQVFENEDWIPCEYKDCKDLEVVAAWDRHHVVDRIMGDDKWIKSIGKPINPNDKWFMNVNTIAPPTPPHQTQSTKFNHQPEPESPLSYADVSW